MPPLAIRLAVIGALALGGRALPMPNPLPIRSRALGPAHHRAQGDVAEIGLEFFRTPKGTLIFRMNFPAMFTYGATFRIPVVADGHGGYAITPAFDVSLQLKGDALTGTFGAGRLPLALHRGGTFARSRRRRKTRPRPPRSGNTISARPPGRRPWWRMTRSTSAPAPGNSTPCTRPTAPSRGPGPGPTPSRPRGRRSGHRLLRDTKMNLIALNRADGALRWSVPLHERGAGRQAVPDNPTFNHRAATPLCWMA